MDGNRSRPTNWHISSIDPLSFAQRVAYCLRLTGAARVVGKQGNRLIYVRRFTNVASDSSNSSRSMRATVVDVSESA